MVEKSENIIRSVIFHAIILPLSNSNVNPMIFQWRGSEFAFRSVFLVFLIGEYGLIKQIALWVFFSLLYYSYEFDVEQIANVAAIKELVVLSFDFLSLCLGDFFEAIEVSFHFVSPLFTRAILLT